MSRRRRSAHDGTGDGGGFGRLLRSLLAGVPWSEHAKRQETLHLPAPSSGIFRVHNANGRTRLVGEARQRTREEPSRQCQRFWAVANARSGRIAATSTGAARGTPNAFR